MICSECQGRGVIYDSPSRDDENVEAITCPTCMGRGRVCESCESPNLKLGGVESREPHGETFRDETERCLDCGAVQDGDVEPRLPVPAGGDYIGEMMRAVMAAKVAGAAERLGMGLAVGQVKQGLRRTA